MKNKIMNKNKVIYEKKYINYLYEKYYKNL